MSDLPDEATTPSRRARSSTPGDDTELAADTAIAVRAGVDSGVAATVISRREVRDTGGGAPDEATVLSRTSGRHGGTASSAPAPPVRESRAPDTAGGVSYRPRIVPPAAPARAPQGRTTPQAAVDTARIEHARRRRARRRAVWLLVGASALVLVALVLLVVLVNR